MFLGSSWAELATCLRRRALPAGCPGSPDRQADGVRGASRVTVGVHQRCSSGRTDQRGLRRHAYDCQDLSRSSRQEIFLSSDGRRTEVAWTRAHLWIRTQSVVDLTPVAVATGRALRTSQRFWPTWCDRVSERKVDQSRAAGQQRGFVDISGCIGRCPDHDQEPEQN